MAPRKDEKLTPSPIPELTAEEVARCFDAVANTPEGQTVLRVFLTLTAYDKQLMTFNPATSDLNPNATIYNLSKRDVWLKARGFLTPKKRALIENDYQEV